MCQKSATPRILFVTSSFRTRWEAYSQALIRASGLAHRVLVLDGRSHWHPLNFVDQALAFDSDFIIHIDEDCFLLDPAQLSSLISKMAADPAVVAAGVPDGGTPYRTHNPLACNLYFTVLKTQPLREMVERRPDWRALRFNPEYAKCSGLAPAAADPSGPASFDDFEPYYPIFWLILEESQEIHYLRSTLHSELLASQVFYGSDSRPMALHAWHLRKWFSKESDPDMGISPAEKYKRISARLNAVLIRHPKVLLHFVCSVLRLIYVRAKGRE